MRKCCAKTLAVSDGKSPILRTWQYLKSATWISLKPRKMNSLSIQSADLHQTKALHTCHILPLSSLPITLFPFDSCKFSALDTWNSPARPPLKAQGSWSPLRNCAEDWLRHPVRSRAKRTVLPQDGALWHRWGEWGDGEKGGSYITNSIIHIKRLILF